MQYNGFKEIHSIQLSKGVLGLRNWNEKGLTLIEVMAATVLLGIAVTIFMNISGYMSNSRQSDDRRTEAIIIAEKKLNEYRADYSIPDKRIYTSLATTDPVNEKVAELTESNYSVKIQHSPINNLNADPGTANYDMTNVKNKLVSLQAIILVKNSVTNSDVPRLMTVTVSWDG